MLPITPFYHLWILHTFVATKEIVVFVVYILKVEIVLMIHFGLSFHNVSPFFVQVYANILNTLIPFVNKHEKSRFHPVLGIKTCHIHNTSCNLSYLSQYLKYKPNTYNQQSSS